MTQRRPAHEAVPDFVERQIREAQQRGAFDDLRASGRPLPDLDQPRDRDWWIRRTAREEQIDDLPPALRIRRDRDRAVAAALATADEAEARRLLEGVNARIRRVNATAAVGPPTSTGVLDVAQVMQRWRRAHPVTPPVPDEVVAPPAEGARRGVLARLAAPLLRRWRS